MSCRFVHQRAHTIIKALHNYNVIFFVLFASNLLVLPIILLSFAGFKFPYLLFSLLICLVFSCLLHIFLKILGSVWRLLEFLAFIQRTPTLDVPIPDTIADFGSPEPPKSCVLQRYRVTHTLIQLGDAQNGPKPSLKRR